MERASDVIGKQQKIIVAVFKMNSITTTSPYLSSSREAISPASILYLGSWPPLCHSLDRHLLAIPILSVALISR
jgi:hypothetical protein